MKHGFSFIATILVALLLTLLVGECSQGQTVRYFTGSHCGPCQIIKPQVEALRAQGLPIEIISVDNGAPAGITSIPAFQLIDANGRVAKQWTGTLNEAEIRAWVKPQPTSECNQLPSFSDFIVKVDDRGNTTSYGSGTPVRKHRGGTIVLTNWHVVSDRAADTAVTVCVPNKGSFPGRVLATDEAIDAAAILVEADLPCVTMGDDVVPETCLQARGWAGGKSLRVYSGRVRDCTPTGYFLSCPAYNGMSGGGVFQNNRYVGIIYGGDPSFCAITSVTHLRPFLDRVLGRVEIEVQVLPTPQQPQQSSPSQSGCNCVEKFQAILARMDAQDKKIESLSNFQCPTPEPGPPGPAGPAGPQGIQGEQGPPGKDANTTNLEQRIAELENRKIKLEIYRDGKRVGVSEGTTTVRVNIKQLEESLQSNKEN